MSPLTSVDGAARVLAESTARKRMPTQRGRPPCSASSGHSLLYSCSPAQYRAWPSLVWLHKARRLRRPPQTTGAHGDFSAMVDIGGRALYLTCSGEGSPTVILDGGGFGGGVNSWVSVQPGVAEITRVCSFDRADVDQSDPAPKPRTAADAVADLHALLSAAQVPGPYVLVGASISGLFARLYGTTYPEDVVGMVLLDPSNEYGDAVAEAMAGPELWAEVLPMWAGSDPEGFWGDDGFILEETKAQLRASRRAGLPDIPLIVAVPERPFDASCCPEGWPIETDLRLWTQLQREVADLVPRGRVVDVDNSGHEMHFEQPDAVVDLIADVVEAAREPSSWETATSPAGTPVS
jgi:pimeloyl-ACP methyl ester carboxylesterase